MSEIRCYRCCWFFNASINFHVKRLTIKNTKRPWHSAQNEQRTNKKNIQCFHCQLKIIGEFFGRFLYILFLWKILPQQFGNKLCTKIWSVQQPKKDRMKINSRIIMGKTVQYSNSHGKLCQMVIFAVVRRFSSLACCCCN